MRVNVARTLTLLAALLIPLGVAAAAKMPFEIAAGEAPDALREFGRQARVQLLFEYRLVRDLKTRAVMGDFEREDALAMLLNGTGLRFEFVNERTVAIHSGARTFAEAKGEGSGDAAVRMNNWLDRFRLAQADQRTREETPAPSTGSTQSSSETSERRALEEVIVTAQKREERLIDVPQSMSIVSADVLTKTGALQFRDYADTVPGLSFQTEGAGTGQISLRGVSVGKDASPTVGIYVDEVPYGSSSSFARSAQFTLDAAPFDIERIEVLRGPQGTLYGTSTMGGLLKYVTKQPDAERFAVDVKTGISSTHEGGVSHNVAAAVNAPIVTDKLALRASAYESHDGGYIDNIALGQEDVNRSDTHGGRLDLLFKSGEAITIRVNGVLQDISGEGTPFADFTQTGIPIDGSLEQQRFVEESVDSRFRLGSATLSYDLGSALLTSISSYQTTESGIFRDQTRTLAPTCPARFGRACSTLAVPFGASTDKFAQELRLASAGTRTLEWLFGGFYTRETSEDHFEFVAHDVAGQLVPNTGTNFNPSRYEEWTAFGDLTWRLTEKLDATGGVRYAQNRTSFEQIGSGTLGVTVPLSRAKDDIATYLANARYHFSERATGYVRFATGYRPGGPNFFTIDPATGQPPPGLERTFESDRLKSYELGFKGETADRRFGVDVAGYFVDWDNIIITVSRGIVGSVRDNAPGGAEVRGAELTLTARPIEAFSLTGAFAYQDAVLSETDPDLLAAKGESLPGVPRRTAALMTDYELPIEGWQSTIGATLRFMDERTAVFDNGGRRPQIHLPDYFMVDLRAGVALGAVNVQLYVRNVTDERGQTLSRVEPPSRVPFPIGILQPRTIGVTASATF